MSYNLTGIASNTTGLLTFTHGVNNHLMEGLLGVLILITLSVVFFGSFMVTTGDAKKSVTATAFLTFGLCFMLRMVSLVSDLALFVCLIGSAVAIAFTWRE